MKLGKISSVNLVASFIRYGVHIFFMIAIGVMAYLSFVDNLGLSPSVRNLTTIALIALVLNYMTWDNYYLSNYNGIMTKDLKNSMIPDGYCIHRRFYNARRGWSYESLQRKIHEFNKEFIEAYIQDIEDVTGRKREEIIDQPYHYKYSYVSRKKTKWKWKSYPHRKLIRNLKHKRYPKSGLRSARDLLNILKIGKSGSMSIKINAAEVYHTAHRIKKVIASLLGTSLVAALVYDFISGDKRSALLKMMMNIVLLFSSMLSGAMAGNRGAQIKMSTAEEVCERLEEWKNAAPSEEPCMANIAIIPQPTTTEQVIEPPAAVIEFT